MQTHCTKKRLFLSFLIAIFALTSTTSNAVTNQEAVQIKVASSANQSLFSDWFKSRNRTTTTIKSPTESSEIWGRVRQHFHIHVPDSAPTFQRYLKRYAKSQHHINELVRNASPYLHYVLGEVEKRGMPSEIALLPMIESDFDPDTISHKGAVGIWQIMPSLGKLYGIKPNTWYDGRKDIYESTKIALDYLEYLHHRFNGNWHLALAAYNSGETRVYKAIKKNRAAKKGTDYWSLPLPQETKNYVPKLLALVTIIKSPKAYGVNLPKIEDKPVFARVDTGKAFNIQSAAKMVNVSETQLRKLNPGLHKKAMHPNGPFNLVIPIQQTSGFKIAPLSEEVPKTAPRIRSKAQIVEVASDTPTIGKPLQGDKNVVKAPLSKTATQNLSSSTKEKSDKPAIVKSDDATNPNEDKKEEKKEVKKEVKKETKKEVKKEIKATQYHVIKKGESINTVVKKYNIRVETLLKYNKNLKNAYTVVKPGQRIIIAVSA